MNIAALRENLEKLDGEERIEAETLLNSLNIAFKKPAAKPRGTITSRLKPYYERIDFTCSTCAHKYPKHFHFTERVMNSQHVLVATPMVKKDFGVESIPIKTRKSIRTTCKMCSTNMQSWPKDELVGILLSMLKGEEFKRAEKEEENDA